MEYLNVQCPLLFTLYINDIPLNISDSNTDMYADDSTIHFSGKHISDIQTKVQEDLNRIELCLLWCKDNNMFINCIKTKYMYDSWNKAKTCMLK